MNKLLKNTESKAQKVWVWSIRIIGFLLFIAPLALPFLAYFQEDKTNVPLTGGDWAFLGFGFLLSSGGKAIGMVVNNLGILLTAFLNKIIK